MLHTMKFFSLAGLLVVVCVAGLAAQKAALMTSYKGVALGMATAEVRAKLGEPLAKSDEQDFYAFGETESAQVFYDAQHKTTTISIMYSGGTAPTCKDVTGEEATPKADGSVYKKVEFKEAGYSAVYSRTASDTPLTTVTLQKLAGK